MLKQFFPGAGDVTDQGCDVLIEHHCDFRKR